MNSLRFSHRFDQRSWRTILEFCGIYGVTLDYSKISKLYTTDIEDAIRWSEVMGPFVMQTSKQHYHYYNQTSTMWKTFLLKKIANGYKNIQLYQELQMKIQIYDKRIEDEKKNMIRYLREIGSVNGWR